MLGFFVNTGPEVFYSSIYIIELRLHFFQGTPACEMYFC